CFKIFSIVQFEQYIISIFVSSLFKFLFSVNIHIGFSCCLNMSKVISTWPDFVSITRIVCLPSSILVVYFGLSAFKVPVPVITASCLCLSINTSCLTVLLVIHLLSPLSVACLPSKLQDTFTVTSGTPCRLVIKKSLYNGSASVL